ncbi:MAG: translation initiation factor 2 [Pseudomonadota bacterium]
MIIFSGCCLHRLTVVAAAGVLLTACASVTRGMNDDVAFQSTPDGASVLLSTGQSCVTPCSLKVARKTAFKATFDKEGFKPASVNVKTRLSPGGAGAGVVGNALVGGLVGVAVDASTGAMLDHFPNPVVVNLETGETNEPEPVAPEGEPTS